MQPHWESITPAMRTLLAWVGEQNFSRPFYLAGGTALALQLGHRKSVDIDFFSETDEVHEHTRRVISAACAARGGLTLESADGNFVAAIDDVRVGFFSYGYPLLQPLVQLEQVNLAALLDIGLMKLDALMGRGSRKDFYDLYSLAEKIPLDELLEAGGRKFPGTRDFPLMALESFVLFENADRDVQPELFTDVPWPQVREFFEQQAQALAQRWFRD